MDRLRQNAFTLIELLVVVSIIAVLIAVLLPSLTRARQSAEMAQCISNMRGQGQALTAYVVDNDGSFPKHETDWPTNVRLPGANPATRIYNELNDGGYLTDGAITICPIIGKYHQNNFYRDSKAVFPTAPFGGWDAVTGTNDLNVTLSYAYYANFYRDGQPTVFLNNEAPWPKRLEDARANNAMIAHRMLQGASNGVLYDEGHYGRGRVPGAAGRPLESDYNPVLHGDGSVVVAGNADLQERARVQRGGISYTVWY